MDGILVLVRHGESQWNAKHLWTGLTDIGLTDLGRVEARQTADLLKSISFQAAFTSMLSRAQETLSIILDELGQTAIPVYKDAALNERDYGIYTAKNKLEIKAQLGETEFLKLRRGWDYPIPQGESLKQVYARVIPYYTSSILPLVASGGHVLVVAHGNSLRSLMKYLEHISDEAISNTQLSTGEAVQYTIAQDGSVTSVERLRRA